MHVCLPLVATAVHTLSAFTNSPFSTYHIAESWARPIGLAAGQQALNRNSGGFNNAPRRGYQHMGVRGMGVHLRKNNLKGETEVLKRGDTLLIDGLGWAHYLLGRSARVDHGGDYDVVHNIASRELRRLQARGINIRVFKDGNAMHTMKVMEAGSRISKLVEQYATLHGETGGAPPAETMPPRGNAVVSNAASSGVEGDDDGDGDGDGDGEAMAQGDLLVGIRGDTSSTKLLPEALDIGIENREWISQTNDGWQGTRGFPKPRLLTQQLFATVQDTGVELISCDGEADLELARASAEDPTRRTFVLGADNDFLFFAGCRYMTFGSLKFTGDVVRAPVWTRAHLARLVGLSEKQVVEWALLVGNDFTSGIYDTVEFHDLPEMMLRRGRSPHETLWWLRSQAPDFRVTADLRRTYEAGVGSVSDAEFANMALDFSRALYELEPLEGLIERWGGLPRTSSVFPAEGRTCQAPSEGGGQSGGDEAYGAGQEIDREDALCADAIREEPVGCMWLPFRDAPASLADIASTYRHAVSREDSDGDTENRGGHRDHATGDGYISGGDGAPKRAQGGVRAEGCLGNPELHAQVLERPWGDIVLEAIRATVMPRGNGDETWVEADEAQTVALFWCALGKRKYLEDDVKLTWRDIVIALNFQGHLWRLYRRYRFKNPHLNAPMPCAHFHGPTFHAAARDFRRYAESRDPKTETRNQRSKSAPESAEERDSPSAPSVGLDNQQPALGAGSLRLPHTGEAEGEGAGGAVGEQPAAAGVDGGHVLAAR